MSISVTTLSYLAKENKSKTIGIYIILFLSYRLSVEIMYMQPLTYTL